MKKQRLAILVILFLMLYISSGCAKVFRYSLGCAKITADQNFSFFILSDIHHLSKSLYDNGKAFDDFLMTGDGKLLDHSDEIFDAVLEDIRAEAPDFVIITGDMTCNGERVGHEEMVRKLEAVEEMGSCVFVVPGNHDIENPWASQYIGEEATSKDTITEEEFVNLYAQFGYEEAISKDPDSMSYLAMPAQDTWLLMLDTIDYARNMRSHYPTQGGKLKPETLKWIEQCAKLAKDNDARLIAVMHHSLLDHSTLVHEDYTIINSEEVRELFLKYGIEIVFTGHVHLQDIKTVHGSDSAIYDIATSSLLVYPHQYGKMMYTAGRGFDYDTIQVDLDDWSDKMASTGKPSVDFRKYSMDIFIKQCCERNIRCLVGLNELKEEDQEKVKAVLAEMNLMYFSGYRNEAFDKLINTDGYKILRTLPACFTTEYIESMLNDERSDNNSILIPVKDP